MWLDYLSGFAVVLAVLLFFPVALAAWFNGRRWALVLAVGAPLVDLGFYFMWATPVTANEAAITALIRIGTFSCFALLIDLVRRQKAEIGVLQGILPTCAWCKRIRDADDQWQSMEAYISARSAAELGHGICPECAQKHFPKSVQ
ncbi:MAG: hypothetical protein ABJF10_17220 [Chthoniobacter sp.]|uniref:hypothetical protein n=1 Tax=Chthoniobacter sp. TaxID=2510640 RepID=UPI0032A48520